MNKRQTLLAIAKFFEEENGGEPMTLDEYRSFGADAPIKDFVARRMWGSWNRITRAASQVNSRGFNPDEIVRTQEEAVEVPLFDYNTKEEEDDKDI